MRGKVIRLEYDLISSTNFFIPEKFLTTDLAQR